MKKLLPILTPMFMIAGCSKNSTGEKDNVPPVITIISPSNNQVCTPGQLLNITGTITDDNYIAEVHIHVTDLSTGVKYLDVHIYPAGLRIHYFDKNQPSL